MTRIGVYAVDRDDPPDEREYRRLALYDTETGTWAPTSDHEMAAVAPAGETTLAAVSAEVGGRGVVVADADDVPDDRSRVADTTPTVTDRPVSAAPRPHQRGDGPWETVAPTAVTGVIYNTAEGIATVETDGLPREFDLRVPTALDLPRPVTGALAAALFDLVRLPETVDDGWIANDVDTTGVEWALETVAGRAGTDPDAAALLGALGATTDGDDRERVAAALVELRAAARAVARGEEPSDIGATERVAAPTDAPGDDGTDAVGVPGTVPPHVDRETVDGLPPTPWTHPVDRLLAALVE